MSPSNSPIVTIIIPTIAERAEWLAQCLDSILPLPDDGSVELIVSGNGIGESTQQVCAVRSVRVIEHSQRLSATDHGRTLIGLGSGTWTWIVPDDDLVAPGAIARVLGMLREHSPDALIGCTRRFTADDHSDLSVAVPVGRAHGLVRDLATAGSLTGMRIDLGAFLYRQDLLTLEMYDKYRGTSHDVFGAFWEAMAVPSQPVVVVMPDVLIWARQSVKAHDEGAWGTLMGMLRLAELVPAEVRPFAEQSGAAYVGFRPVIRARADGERPQPADVPAGVWRRASARARFEFRLACLCPQKVAQGAARIRHAVPALSRARGAPVDATLEGDRD
jgi:hypothetical protein